MVVSTDRPVGPSRAGRDHGFHALQVREVVAETADACSIVLQIPDELAEAFSYRAGQFVTFRLWVDGQQHLRSYSMSSSPDVDRDFQVTVKRVAGGSVSNWLLDKVRPGDQLETTCPAGVFCLGPDDRDVVAFAAGSGITPIVGIVKTALATTTRRVRLVYANRDRESVIFAALLEDLKQRYEDRLDIIHHLDVEHGLLDTATAAANAANRDDADFFVCGPGPFMTVVEDGLLGRGIDGSRIHIERFTPREEATEPTVAATSDAAAATQVTVELDGKVETTRHRAGTTVLQTARQAGLQPPFSCENGDCATCMAKLVDGKVTMRANNALTDDEVDEGWILTCQAVPEGSVVHVIYGFDD